MAYVDQIDPNRSPMAAIQKIRQNEVVFPISLQVRCHYTLHAMHSFCTAVARNALFLHGSCTQCTLFARLRLFIINAGACSEPPQ